VNNDPNRAVTARTVLSSRRNAMIGGLAAAACWFTGAVGAPLPPSFSSGGHQFTAISPQRMLPSALIFSLAGGSVDLAAFIGCPLLLNFWAAWCAACKSELPALDILSERAGHGGAEVIAVSVDRGSRDQVGRFIQSLAIRKLPIYLDPNGCRPSRS
jgi:thiol-disulfide isomerase/thioredoxin